MTQIQLAPSIGIVRVPDTQRHVIANLLQLYLHDFSEYAGADTPYAQLEETGIFSYPHFENYWADPTRVPLLIRANSHIAGFALIHAVSALDRPVDHCVGEFFIVRKFRRTGVGAAAAKMIFALYPGRWEVPVRSYNGPALAFWPIAIAAAEVGAATTMSGDGARWTGPVYSFDNRSTPPDSLGT